VFPGVAGALCLLLFALTAQVLPMSTIGILLVRSVS
jgi:EamA domain-containing membrane protein RarD